MDKEKIIEALTCFELISIDQRDRIRNMRIQIERDLSSEEKVKEFAKINEEIYLKLKSLIYEIQDEKPKNIMEELGTTDSFPSTLRKIENGVFQFHIPPLFSVSAKKKLYNEGKHIYYLVLNLLSKYESENEKINVMKKPLVIFKHHINTEQGHMFDYDNIDSKRAIDAMQGYFFYDDNALCLTTIHSASLDNTDSYCNIYVVDKEGNPTVAWALLQQISQGN